MRIKEEEIKQILDKADIVEVIEQYLPLSKQGINYLAVCPFHNDTNPSLTISPVKQIYKCFSCGAGGNAITFIQKYQGISYVDAIISLSEKYSVPLENLASLKVNKYTAEDLAYFSVFEEAIAFSNYQLNLPQYQEVMAYLENRKFTKETINDFKIGFVDQNQLVNFLMKKNVSEALLLTTNLAKVNDFRTYDTFNSRIIFPIYNHDCKPVAFSGRSFNDVLPKYLNTAETALYHKGKILFNYVASKSEIRRVDEVIIVEGVIDVMALVQSGHRNVVATLGTALTFEQVKSLKYLTNNVCLAYDEDIAGINANLKAAKLCLEHGLKVSFVANLKDLDPAEYLRVFGEDKLLEAFKKRYTWIEYLMLQLSKKYNLSNYSEKKQYAMTVLKEISKLDDRLDQSSFLNTLSEKTGFEVEDLKSLIKRSPTQKIKSSQKKLVINERRSEYEIIIQLMYNKDAFMIFNQKLGYFVDEDLNNLIIKMKEFYSLQSEFEFKQFIAFLEDDEILIRIITDIEPYMTIHSCYNELSLLQAINQVKIKLIDEQINKLNVDLNIEDNIQKIIDLRRIKEELKTEVENE